VLWILMALSALTVIFSLYLSNSAQALAVNDSGLRVEATVTASIELTAYRLLAADAKTRPSQGSFHFRLNGEEAQVSFSAETARVDLNYASKETLAGLFTVLGANEDAAKEYADRIVGWRTRPTPGVANDEAALYGAAGLTYSPRQAFFVHVNELGLVLGLPPALVERALPFVTIFNGTPNVDAAIASPEVTAAQPKTSQSAPPQEFANASPSLDKANDEPSAQNPGAATPKSTSFRVLTTIKLSDGRRVASEVVIALGGDDDPYRVLSWQNDLPAGRLQQRRVELQ
jgi:general secretion pathway protein K